MLQVEILLITGELIPTLLWKTSVVKCINGLRYLVNGKRINNTCSIFYITI